MHYQYLITKQSLHNWCSYEHGMHPNQIRHRVTCHHYSQMLFTDESVILLWKICTTKDSRAARVNRSVWINTFFNHCTLSVNNHLKSRLGWSVQVRFILLMFFKRQQKKKILMRVFFMWHKWLLLLISFND